MTDRILIVDDDELVLTGLAENLMREGYDVTTASSGREALDVLGRTPVDLVLTDLVMEQPDGMALLRHVAAEAPDLPVIVLTGHGSVASAIDTVRHGAADYLLKPARPDEIAHRIRSVLNTRELKKRMLRERARAQEQRQTYDAREAHRARTVAVERFAAGLSVEISAEIQRAQEVLKPAIVEARLAEAIAGLQALAQRLARFGSSERSAVRPFDLVALMRSHVESDGFLALLDAHPQVIFEFPPSQPPPPPVAISEEVAQALRGVVDVAVRLTTGERRVRVGTRLEHVSRAAGSSDHFVVFCVRFAATVRSQDADHLCEPYFAERELGWKGAGPFVFAEACAAVRRSGGFVDVRTTPDGRAVELAFYLPIASPMPEESSAPRLRARGGERILVVDDSEVHRNEARRLLEELGYDVILAENGAAAVAWVERRIRAGEPLADLMLIDLFLGDASDGVDVFRRIRDLHPHQKAILVGGFVEIERVNEARDEGLSGYLRKPFTLEALGRTIREVLDEP